MLAPHLLALNISLRPTRPILRYIYTQIIWIPEGAGVYFKISTYFYAITLQKIFLQLFVFSMKFSMKNPAIKTISKTISQYFSASHQMP
jgi:hypothetical protein